MARVAVLKSKIHTLPVRDRCSRRRTSRVQDTVSEAPRLESMTEGEGAGKQGNVIEFDLVIASKGETCYQLMPSLLTSQQTHDQRCFESRK